MNRYQRRRARQHDLYSPSFHLNRTVRCQDCDSELHKNHYFVFYGNRCRPCWEIFIASQSNTASH